MNEKVESIKVDGGASNNNFLVQFQSDILQIPVIKPLLSETTSLGAARLAGLAVGFYKLEDFKDEAVKVFEPSMSDEEVVEKYNRWLNAVNATLKF